MKKTSPSEAAEPAPDELLPEYRFDYRKARPNRFATPAPRVVVLDEDIAEAFTTPEAVNKALRALLDAVPSVRPKAEA